MSSPSQTQLEGRRPQHALLQFLQLFTGRIAELSVFVAGQPPGAKQSACPPSAAHILKASPQP